MPQLEGESILMLRGEAFQRITHSAWQFKEALLAHTSGPASCRIWPSPGYVPMSV